jgi:hypothetical protein
MLVIMMHWQDIFLSSFHPFMEWLLVVGAFHILLIFWQRYISIQSFSHGTNELQIFISFFFQLPKKKQAATVHSEFNTIYSICLGREIVSAAVESDDVSDEELAVEEEGVATNAATVPDDGRDAHDQLLSELLIIRPLRK